MQRINSEPEYEKTRIRKNQDKWIDYFNEKKQKMISMPDIYRVLKEKDVVIESLKRDIKEDYLMTSTSIKYDKYSLKAVIIHDRNSTVVKPTMLKVKEIPVCQPTYITELLSTSAGLDYVRALINHSKATKEEIIRNLELLSGKQAKNIKVWTPTLSQRKYRPIRALRLYFDVFDAFFVVGIDWCSNSGLSRRVRIINQKPKVSTKKVKS